MRRSIIQNDDRVCFLCHRWIGTDVHHIFGAANRDKSDTDGLCVILCRECHDAVHFGKNSKELQDKLHRLGQIQWEAVYGPGIKLTTGKEPREAFMERYGRNWL